MAAALEGAREVGVEARGFDFEGKDGLLEGVDAREGCFWPLDDRGLLFGGAVEESEMLDFGSCCRKKKWKNLSLKAFFLIYIFTALHISQLFQQVKM